MACFTKPTLKKIASKTAESLVSVHHFDKEDVGQVTTMAIWQELHGTDQPLNKNTAF